MPVPQLNQICTDFLPESNGLVRQSAPCLRGTDGATVVEERHRDKVVAKEMALQTYEGEKSLDHTVLVADDPVMRIMTERLRDDLTPSPQVAERTVSETADRQVPLG